LEKPDIQLTGGELFFSNKPVKGNIGMTGEVTLRGRVLPVGGIKIKKLAAHRAGLKTVILPQKNTPDLMTCRTMCAPN
jgi:ATP-dependent Lon protease